MYHSTYPKGLNASSSEISLAHFRKGYIWLSNVGQPNAMRTHHSASSQNQIQNNIYYYTTTASTALIFRQATI
jgi:hypothetical protein